MDFVDTAGTGVGAEAEVVDDEEEDAVVYVYPVLV